MGQGNEERSDDKTDGRGYRGEEGREVRRQGVEGVHCVVEHEADQTTGSVKEATLRQERVEGSGSQGDLQV